MVQAQVQERFDMSGLLRRLAVPAILGLGLLVGGIPSSAMADHGQTHPPKAPPPLGEGVSGEAGDGQGTSSAVRTLISETIQNPRVLSPIE